MYSQVVLFPTVRIHNIMFFLVFYRVTTDYSFFLVFFLLAWGLQFITSFAMEFCFFNVQPLQVHLRLEISLRYLYLVNCLLEFLFFIISGQLMFSMRHTHLFTKHLTKNFAKYRFRLKFIKNNLHIRCFKFTFKSFSTNTCLDKLTNYYCSLLIILYLTMKERMVNCTHSN